MKRVLEWLGSKFSRHSIGVEEDDCHTPVAVTTKDIVKEENAIKTGGFKGFQCFKYGAGTRIRTKDFLITNGPALALITCF